MAFGKWIGGFLGFAHGGPLGALAGFALGWLFDRMADAPAQDTTAGGSGGQSTAYADEARRQQGQRNSFLFSLLVLSAYIIRADGRIMHSEMEHVRRFLRVNFGEAAVSEGEQTLRRLFEQQKQMGDAQFRQVITACCQQMAQYLTYEQRLQLLSFLVGISKADGVVAPEEVEALCHVTSALGLTQADLDSMLNLSAGRDNLEAAYKVLGVEPTATDDEVKKAYRAMALKHHPDRVATLGEDIRKAAEKKFQEINDAKERIFKARGL